MTNIFRCLILTLTALLPTWMVNYASATYNYSLNAFENVFPVYVTSPLASMVRNSRVLIIISFFTISTTSLYLLSHGRTKKVRISATYAVIVPLLAVLIIWFPTWPCLRMFIICNRPLELCHATPVLVTPTLRKWGITIALALTASSTTSIVPTLCRVITWIKSLILANVGTSI